ncbi:DUF4865 family protein [Lactococcus termiticola]|uniref:DUF4865 family protein n=1 Tax=Lactococcus termiticola TaxID=2169526 RepID=UPI000D65AAA5
MGIPLQLEVDAGIKEATYVLEIEKEIPRAAKMNEPSFSLRSADEKGCALIYNPDKWHCVEFYFFEEYPTEFAEKRAGL